MLLSLLGFACVIGLAFLRVPIAIAMGVVGAIGFAGLNNWNWTAALSPAGGSVLDTLQTESLSVIPLVVLMGMLVSQAGLATELYRASNAFLGHRRGGLAMATIVACGGFSAISGSSLATAATMAKVAMPEMRRYGYSGALATGVLAVLTIAVVLLGIFGVRRSRPGEKFITLDDGVGLRNRGAGIREGVGVGARFRRPWVPRPLSSRVPARTRAVSGRDRASASTATRSLAEKATKVAGVYTADPEKDPTAEFIPHISFQEALTRELGVMDTAAVAQDTNDDGLPDSSERGLVLHPETGEHMVPYPTSTSPAAASHGIIDAARP